MILTTLLTNVKTITVKGNDACDIKSLCLDSRNVTTGDCFVATCGTSVDGHTFIPQVVEKGAAAIVCQTLPETLVEGVTYIQVSDSREALGIMASNFYGNPSKKMTLVGVTGTNGKTSIATLLWQLFRKLGYKVGLLSTVVNYIDDKAVPSTHTTPDPLELNRLLAEMLAAGCAFVFMEVSSHSVDQRRIAGLKYAGGIFTNLTRDHLDYHKTVENYLKAKKRFFDDLPADAFAVTNADDRNGLVMLQNTKARRFTYSVRSVADFRGRIDEESIDGMQMNIDSHDVFMPFVGRFNASNVMAVYATAVQLGVEPLKALTIISSLHAVAGRFETIRGGNGVTAIVDYAHTPDALENVIRTINEIKRGRLITVCGCGGNRDKGKRPMMAREAVRGSELVVLTSDNPRDEEPDAILADMTAGLDEEGLSKVTVLADRREAIKLACTLLAKPGDIVLIAGKGHEDYQIIKGVKHHFDDREEAKKYLLVSSINSPFKVIE
ncbi:MAG: UDP-N-acetylmuramoyl-L-alanyl-D-glutamate--2,6-diaminopimelate ligase [Paludibacteraceae bacterium]|nr:UDP-N-acetylmuramoyl-L-alanyl-D-glutamate--2,6-diaminopimelate ligase [Paludibacteraceae bacterium]